MRVLSMQGKEVWEILQRDKVYHASPKLCREDNNYSKDIEILEGYQPIWCYARPEINFKSMYNGEILEYLRCEMSLEQCNCWDNFVMLELEINRDETHIGDSYNACAYSRIFREITMDMVKAAYTLKDADVHNPYYKVLTPIYTSCHDVITTVEMNCKTIVEKVDESTEGLEYSDKGKCLVCGEDTEYTYKNKHFCCLGHGWEHEHRYKRICKQYNIPDEVADSEYERLTDQGLLKGTVKAVKSLVGK